MPIMLNVFLSERKHLFRYEYLLVVLFAIIAIQCQKPQKPQVIPHTTKLCLPVDKDTLRAKHKSCFLRPDTGPCRADIIQYYFDASMARCYRFFWGGCQGNGNRFDDLSSCMGYCYVNSSMYKTRVPHFCSLAFDFGTCFGHYNRWTWDKTAKTCKRRLYSGCGGNQNNFESLKECMSTCLTPPNNTLNKLRKYTTCIPFTIQNNH